MLEPAERSYTVAQLSKLSGLSEWTIHRLIREGSLKAFLPCGHRRGMRVYESEAAEKLNLERRPD